MILVVVVCCSRCEIFSDSKRQRITAGACVVRPTRYAHCGESPRGAAMMRNPRPEEQLRGGNKPWKRKFEGKSRLYEQKLHIRPDGWTRLPQVPKSDTSSRIHKVDADGAGGK